MGMFARDPKEIMKELSVTFKGMGTLFKAIEDLRSTLDAFKVQKGIPKEMYGELNDPVKKVEKVLKTRLDKLDKMLK